MIHGAATVPNGGRIAIVGLGAMLPAAASIDAFWSNVLAGHSASRPVPEGRWLLSTGDAYDPHHHPAPRPDKVYSTRACLLDDFTLDPRGLAIDRDLLRQLDPVCHLALSAGRAAFDDAKMDHVDRSRAGVIIGNIALPTDASSRLADEILGRTFEERVLGKLQSSPQRSASKTDAVKTHVMNRYVAGLPGGLLAQALQLGGGSYTLDAACASSLYAVKLACDELLAGRADAMLAGGMSRPDCLYTQMGFAQLRALSPSGVCGPFDAKADGLVVGEGAGFVMLKRVEDALHDGDHIYAVIVAAGLSNDIGGTLFLPDSEGQLRAMRSAYQQAGWSPADVDLIECHGTGTPTGDAVEFASLMQLWRGETPPRPCVIGSVKSNVGHLLTGAGGAGLIKTLLALKHRTLPPTANFERPAAGVALDGSPFTILKQPRPWEPRGDHPRRAAVSAFGFGGINAHLLLEEWREPAHHAAVPAIKPAPPRIAIVGMAAQFGPWRDLRSFQHRVLGGDRHTQPKPLGNAWGVEQSEWFGASGKTWPHGFTIDRLRIALERFRIPPAELKQMLPQQLLMLQVAAEALDDAGMTSCDHLRTGVYIGIELDLNTTNFHFRWSLANRARHWARQLELDADEQALDRWIAQLRDVAGPALNADRTMGALGGIVASRVARAFKVGGPSFTISSEETSGLCAAGAAMRALHNGEIDAALVGAVDLQSDIRAALTRSSEGEIGEGAGALVLKRYDDALRDGDRVYAMLTGAGEGDAPVVALRRAADEARVAPAALTVIDSEQTMAAIGAAGAAAGFASLVQAAVALYQQIHPWSGDAERPAAFWLRNRAEGPRRAVVTARGAGGNSAAVALEEHERQPDSPDRARPLGPWPEALFALEADSVAGLHEQLTALARRVESSDDLQGAARAWWREHPLDARRSRAVAMVAGDTRELRSRIAEAREALDAKPPFGSEPQGRREAAVSEGVFYSPSPLGREGKVAFVFPGSGNHFAGMGRDLAAYFPAALRRQDAENLHLCGQFAGGRFWNERDLQGLNGDHEAMIFGQVSLGTLVSDVVRLFGIEPRAVIGYSLGETAGLFSTRTWTQRDEMLRRMRASALFTRDLAGPCEAVRQAWGLSAGETVDWVVGVISRPAAQVREHLGGRRRVYLLIVNTPRQCVIGGDRAAVEQFVCDLGCRFHPVTGVTTVHCEVARPVERAYRDLHLFDTTPPAGVTFYSGVWGGSYAVTRDSAADSILLQALQPFDYTKVIESAYADGVRIFLEMGPGSSCSRMIADILGDRPHVAIPACVAGQSGVSSVLRIVARMIAERVPVDLSVICGGEERENTSGRMLEIELGGGEFKVPAPLPRRSAKPQAATKAHALLSPEAVLEPVIVEATAVVAANAAAHERFLELSREATATMARVAGFQMMLVAAKPPAALREAVADVALDRGMCVEFAIGSIAKVLGPAFAEVDEHPTRVRLPDEPLMLVDRIVEVEGEPRSMTSGRVVTEHDILPGAWYLDGGRIPTCIAVEAGQADLFLCGYLGIDLITKGQAVYRLLDAVVTFHGPLPEPGKIIRYDIHIDRFFRQGETHLFRFRFEGTVDGEPLLSMRNGVAGFFTPEELDAGKGIVHTELDLRPMPGKKPADWRELVPMTQVESYSDEQVARLRQGDYTGCFGPAFSGLKLRNPLRLPGGGGSLMKLVHRVLELDPRGGRYGIGQITGEADIHPQDWFLTCHFVDDRVMPGTLMYECCLHTLRIFLLRMGWVGEHDEVWCEPIPGVNSQLKCRGQVIESTKKVQYRIALKEIGYNPEPYAIADALMFADGKPIVEITNMSVRLGGLTREKVEGYWQLQSADIEYRRPAIFDYDRILAFAIGKPSEAFGERYRVFDEQRTIARLPGPPYQFLDRVTKIENCRPWELAAGGVIEAQYDVPPDAWYFAANRQPIMPFAVLLEVALQPCGWLAAYLGSALHSDEDLRFRNLGGKAVQHRMVTPGSGTLTTTVSITRVAKSGGMIIANFDMQVFDRHGLVYQGDTYFGFFSEMALANQVGVRDAKTYEPTAHESAIAESFSYPQQPPFADTMLRMIDEVTLLIPDGGPAGLGFIRGIKQVDPAEWFFKAHFHQDPVCPGSLGLESFLQLLKLAAVRRWNPGSGAMCRMMAPGQNHEWIYRGQILPTHGQVMVDAVVTDVDEPSKTLRGEGCLRVDGRIIYQMKDFGIRIDDHAL